MPRLVATQGLPASGKTTWTKEVVATNLDCLTEPDGCLDHVPTKTLRVNRDSLRLMMHDGRFIKGVTEEVVIAARDSIIRAALRKGWDVIVDDTNLSSRNIRDLLTIANREGAEFSIQPFDVSVDECVTRDKLRLEEVGEDVIRDQYNRYLNGKSLPLPIPQLKESKFEPLPPPPAGSPQAVIVDIDGTVAHNDGHRGFYDYDKVWKDTPKMDVIRVVQSLIKDDDVVPIFLSGREDTCRYVTAEWLVEWVIPYHYLFLGQQQSEVALLDRPNNSQGMLGSKLLMREAGDHRDDALVKYELYRDHVAPYYNIITVFDDRDRVVRMWRQIGLTCMQVNYGDF